MRRLGALLLAAGLAALGGAAQAELRLRLDDHGLQPAEIQATQALLDEARAALPPRLVDRLDREVTVRWSERLPEHGYGRAGGSLIELNRALLADLAEGRAATQATGRPHGTVRRELLATVIHELGHLYDRARLWPAAERTLIGRCAIGQQTLGPVGLPDACRGLSERRFTLSDDPRLLDLAGWPQQVGTRGAREAVNGQLARSPDPYELSSPLEFVAVNLEYFLLDPSYACRRPGLARFFATHFDWQPPGTDECGARYPILNAGSDFARNPLLHLDPARVYAVDYLFAEANDAWVSRWGHSMLRLIVCAPGRPRGPDCRLDLDEHLVLSFRAFVGDVQLSSWRGLTGQYPSRLFILPLAQVIDEYTKVELRALSSIPLRLTRAQLEALVERSVEMHWSYDGDYYFLSNNCAVETLKLLRSGTARAELTTLDSITPSGLLEVLQARGLADRSVLDNPAEALRLGYRFDSYRDRYQAMFEVLRERLPVQQADVEAWLDAAPEARRRWFEQADMRAGAALLLLEQAALRRQLMLAQDELKRLYFEARERDAGELAEADRTLQAILASSGFLSRPAELLESGGYGLPQPPEWQRLEAESGARQAELNRLSDALDREVRALLSRERQETVAQAEANVGQLRDRLRALHKASGGLQLN
ncbi:DUF7844 domain-containing protein [Stutzerimonas azotifigens]|uniref:DUF7844 domain-containing protein n=1 Tax=Stutzerimonas azotifigens TaxID=291995 RepID=UPI000412E669|nr:DUF4105 domain-containing protein [Stutzerimonas azotifigens]